MNDEPTAESPLSSALPADHLLDALEQSVGDGADAHTAEERVVQELRRLGQELLGQWAQEAAAQAQVEVPRAPPEAGRHG